MTQICTKKEKEIDELFLEKNLIFQEICCKISIVSTLICILKNYDKTINVRREEWDKGEFYKNARTW